MTKKRKRKIELKKIDKECWNLDLSFVSWLEQRLEIYKKRADEVVDLHYHDIEVDGLVRDQFYWINEMLALCSLVRFLENKADDYGSELIKLGHIWAELLPYMWW